MKTYEIRIACALSDTLTAAFPELHAVQISDDITMLTGPVRDQSELHEFIARLANLGLEITEIRRQP